MSALSAAQCLATRRHASCRNRVCRRVGAKLHCHRGSSQPQSAPERRHEMLTGRQVAAMRNRLSNFAHGAVGPRSLSAQPSWAARSGRGQAQALAARALVPRLGSHDFEIGTPKHGRALPACKSCRWNEAALFLSVVVSIAQCITASVCTDQSEGNL
jgi:hypothetical protein